MEAAWLLTGQEAVWPGILMLGSLLCSRRSTQPSPSVEPCTKKSKDVVKRKCNARQAILLEVSSEVKVIAATTALIASRKQRLHHSKGAHSRFLAAVEDTSGG